MKRFLAVAALLVAVPPLLRADDKAYAAELKAAGHSPKLDAAGHLAAVTFNKSETLTDADYERIGRLTHITRLTFYGTCLMTDANAAHLGRLTTLEEVAINGTALSDEGFKSFGKLVNLRKLIFWHLGWKKVPITGRGFAELANCPKLETFGFSGSAIGDEGLAALAKVKQLKSVDCYHTRVTDAGLAHLKKLPDLRGVRTGPQFSMRLGDAGLTTLAGIPTLERIEYGETILTYTGSLKELKKLKGLKEVKLEKVEVAAADLDRLKADLPGVTITHTPPEAKMLDQMRKAAAKK